MAFSSLSKRCSMLLECAIIDCENILKTGFKSAVKHIWERRSDPGKEHGFKVLEALTSEKGLIAGLCGHIYIFVDMSGIYNWFIWKYAQEWDVIWKILVHHSLPLVWHVRKKFSVYCSKMILAPKWLCQEVRMKKAMVIYHGPALGFFLLANLKSGVPPATNIGLWYIELTKRSLLQKQYEKGVMQVTIKPFQKWGSELLQNISQKRTKTKTLDKYGTVFWCTVH